MHFDSGNTGQVNSPKPCHARRVGLLPRIVRPRRHVTHTRAAAPPPQQAAGGALRTLRVLRPRPALAFDSDSDEDPDFDSPTSSSTLSAVGVRSSPALCDADGHQDR